MADRDIHKSSHSSLAAMLALEKASKRVWRPEELGDVLEHQLRVPVQFDLAGIPPELAAKLGTLAAAEGLLIKSFDDLFAHPHPPVELLVLTKDFAKAIGAHPDGALPPDVAQVIYYMSIAAALVRCSRRISSLDDASLRKGLSWAAALPWVQPSAKQLIQKGLDLLAATGGAL